MKKGLVCLVMMLLARFCGGCMLWHTTTTYNGSEKAYGMHPEWTDKEPDYMPSDDIGNASEN